MGILSKITKTYKKYGATSAFGALMLESMDGDGVREKDVLGFIKLLKNENEDLNEVLGSSSETIVHDFHTPAIIKAYVEAGGDINARNIRGETPLEYYLRTETVAPAPAIVKAFFENGAKPDIGEKSYAETILEPYFARWNLYGPLDSATRKNITELLKLGKEYGANINSDTEISWLYKIADLELIETLIELGYDPNRLFKNLGRYNYPLLYEITKLEVNRAKLLLENGANPNLSPSDTGVDIPESPLWHLLTLSFNSFYKKDIDTLTELLVQHGADLNTKNKKGCTYLNFQPEKEAYIPVKTLLKFGASIETAPDGDTPLHKYVKRVPPECVKEDIMALLNAGVDLEAKNNGKTAFAIACLSYVSYISVPRGEECQNYISLLKTLVQEGADINALTKDGIAAINFLPKDLQKELFQIAEYRKTIEDAESFDTEIYER